MKYELIKVFDNIYLLNFEERYDLCMFFLRYQEFYESPNPDFNGEQFEIIDFMEWYSKEFGDGVFTYPGDWSGFNIPSRIIDEIKEKGIVDKNKYDYEMLLLHQKLKAEANGNYYLIGTSGNYEQNIITLAHECGHGLFYTNPIYKERMLNLVRSLEKDIYVAVCTWLSERGYCSNVFEDETHAYMATGFPKGIEFNKSEFRKLFNEYAKDIPMLKDWGK